MLFRSFVDEWAAAMDRGLQGFIKYKCFDVISNPPKGTRTLPGSWIFSRKRDGTAKARFVMGGHRQRLGIDYFEYKNY